MMPPDKTTDFPGPSDSLVRAFSDATQEEEPTPTLVRSLSIKIQRDRAKEQRIEVLRREWPLLFADADRLAQIEVPAEEAQLLRCSRALAVSWKQFQQKLPPQEQEALQDTPPSLSTLFNAVKAAANKWQTERDESKWGKAKAVFAKLGRSADDHSQLLAVVPNNDKYCSLIVGSLSAIANAAVRHEELAIALTESLEQLCEDIAHWSQRVRIHAKVPCMQQYVRELYVVVFEFLSDIFIKWSASGLTRFARSFDKNAADKLFKSKQAKIKRLTEMLDRAATLDTEAQVFALNDHVMKLESGVSKEYMEQFIIKLGGSVQRLLQEHEFRVEPRLQISPSAPVEQQITAAAPKPQSHVDLCEYDIHESIPHLDDLLATQLNSMHTFTGRVSHLRIESRVTTKLRNWAPSSGFCCLWIEGPAHVPKPSQNTLTAVALAAILQENNPTVILYCSSMDLDVCQMLRQMVNSLIAQIATLLPPRVSCQTDLSKERIAKDMELQAPLSDRISLLKDIEELVRRPVFYIIDGLEAAEDRSNRNHSHNLQDFIDHLCDNKQRSSASGTTHKVCFTTDGHSDALARQVSLMNVEKIAYDVECDEMMAEEGLLDL